MPQLDLGKQIGPLPLGAWIVVVGGGLGIALYTRRMGQSSEPVIDTSPDPGVGEGGFQPTPPGTPVTEHPLRSTTYTCYCSSTIRLTGCTCPSCLQNCAQRSNSLPIPYLLGIALDNNQS